MFAKPVRVAAVILCLGGLLGLIGLGKADPISAQMAGTPPLGKYQVRQYMTTVGYVTLLDATTYEVGGVKGEYAYDPSTGNMNWTTGSYQKWGWEGKYEFLPALEERPAQHVIRIESRSDGLKMDAWYLTH